MSDSAELNLYLGDEENPENIELLVRCHDGNDLTFTGIADNPQREDNMWIICHTVNGRNATSYIPANEVRCFTTLQADDKAATENKADSGKTPEEVAALVASLTATLAALEAQRAQLG